MAAVTACPACGENEELRGEPSDGDIKVTCLTCGAQWMRGGLRCASCGGQDIVHRPQAMTRHSRGTQLSIIGWRELPLCRSCDAEALHSSISQNIPVPSDYVAACLGAAQRPAAPAAPQSQEAPSPAPADSREVPPNAPARKDTVPKAPEPGAAGKAAAPRSRPQAAGPKAARPPSMVPTVRQAIAAFMTEASSQADATAMLLLGTHLGSHNRLTVLDEDGAPERLADWCLGHWNDGSDRSQRALDTVRRAVDFWGARGWLTSDPAAGLR
ncbi:hypothetical protein QNO09_01780 [Streptomyces sp. 378]|uniref:hypothetical protein n=1 Tax=Streptomyces sp. 378 TaxID=3049412 RepID=UPI0024C2145F|nr:hypothetical protein [Streptomyces sp. 378]MDK1342066.1 hypothetical protein [Streptomyces sp. 378]